MICQIHNTQMTQRESKTKLDDEGMPKKYFAHGFGDDICFGTPTNGKVEQKPTPLVETAKEVFAKKHDSMLMCNAMNNATALVSAGVKTNLEETYLEILKILEGS